MLHTEKGDRGLFLWIFITAKQRKTYLQCSTEFNKSRSVYRIVKQNRLELEHQQLIKFRGALVNANLKLWFERVEHNY